MLLSGFSTVCKAYIDRVRDVIFPLQILPETCINVMSKRGNLVTFLPLKISSFSVKHAKLVIDHSVPYLLLYRVGWSSERVQRLQQKAYVYIQIRMLTPVWKRSRGLTWLTLIEWWSANRSFKKLSHAHNVILVLFVGTLYSSIIWLAFPLDHNRLGVWLHAGLMTYVFTNHLWTYVMASLLILEAPV